jgi:hypothetical protein
MRSTSFPDALPNFCLVVSDDLQNMNSLQRKVRKELGLQTLVERRDRQDMALVHEFLTEKSGTDMFRQIAANGIPDKLQAAMDSVSNILQG